MSSRLQRRLEEIGAPDDVKALAAELAERAVRDPLTGLYNRRYFDESLQNHMEAARRYGRDLSLVLFDLDRFKQINDTEGHSAGDAALKAFGQCLRRNARRADIICRIGGDEFAALLPETSLRNAHKFAERLAALDVKCGGATPLSWSAGVAALPSDDLFAAADCELLRLKALRREERWVTAL